VGGIVPRLFRAGDLTRGESELLTKESGFGRTAIMVRGERRLVDELLDKGAQHRVEGGIWRLVLLDSVVLLPVLDRDGQNL
jgi:hypothetical protein